MAFLNDGVKVSVSTIVDAAYQAGFRGNALVIAVAVALGESIGGYADAWNNEGEDSRGLWQINVAPNANPRYRDYDLTDPYVNAGVAYEMSRGGANFTPWTVFTTGAYLGHMAAAGQAAQGAGQMTEPNTSGITIDASGSGGTTAAGVISFYGTPAVKDAKGKVTAPSVTSPWDGPN